MIENTQFVTIPQQIFKNTLKITHLKHSLTNPTPPKNQTQPWFQMIWLHLPFSAVSASWSKQQLEVTEAPRWGKSVWLQSRKATRYSTNFPPSWRFEITFFSSFVRIIFAYFLDTIGQPFAHSPLACFTTSSNLLIMLKVAPTAFRSPNHQFIDCSWVFLLDSKHGMTNVPVHLSFLSVSGCRSSLLTMWSLCIDVSSRIRNPQPSQNIIEVGKRVCVCVERILG